MSDTIVRGPYTVGSEVEIDKYNIFDPAPSSWNEDLYGQGTEYHEDQQIIFTQSLDLYGQFGQRIVTYHLFNDDTQICQYIDYWRVNYKEQIEIPEYKYSGFKCWTINGKQYSPGEYYYVSNDIDMLPSCTYNYTMSFDGRSHIGSLDPITKTTTKDIYYDGSTYQQRTINQTVILPENPYTPDKYHDFNGWNILGQSYQPGDVYQLQANVTAYAIWAEKYQYILDLHIQPEDYGTIYKIQDNRYEPHKILQAIPKNSNYEFIKWLGDIDSTDNPVSFDFAQTGTKTISAYFICHTDYVVNIACDQQYGSTEVTTKDIFKPEEKQVKANTIDNTLYEFVRWIGVEEQYQTDNPLSVTLTKDVPLELTATFKIKDGCSIITYNSGCEQTTKILNSQILTKDSVQNDSTEYKANTTIIHVQLGDSVTTLDSQCLYNAVNLQNIDNLKVVEMFKAQCLAKTNITSLQFNDVDPLYIYSQAFSQCNQISTINIPSNICFLNDSCFSQMRNLSSIVFNIPNSTDMHSPFMGDSVFANNRALTSVIFKQGNNSTITLGEKAFYNCPKLSTIDFTAIQDEEHIIDIAEDTFDECGTIANRKIVFKDENIAEAAIMKSENWARYADDIYPKSTTSPYTLLQIDTSTANRIVKAQLKFKNTTTSGTIYWGDNETTAIKYKKGQTQSVSHSYTKPFAESYVISVDNIIETIQQIHSSPYLSQIVFGSNVKTLVARIAKNNTLTKVIFGYNFSTYLPLLLNQCSSLKCNASTIKFKNPNQSLFNEWVKYPMTKTNQVTLTPLMKRSHYDCLTVTEDVEYISTSTFDMHYIDKLEFPSSIEYVQCGAVVNSQLASIITVDSNNQKYESRNLNLIIQTSNNKLFAGNICAGKDYSSLQEIAAKACIGMQLNSTNTIVVPSNITAIGEYAFSSISTLNIVDFRSNTKYSQTDVKSDIIEYNWIANSASSYQDVTRNYEDMIGRQITIKHSSGDFIVGVQGNTDSSTIIRDSRKAKIKAVVVVLERWKNSSTCKPLPGTSIDGTRYKDWFESMSIDVTLLMNEDATVARVKSAITAAVSTATDQFIYVFAGHGGNEGSYQYMCCYDEHFKDNEFWSLIQSATCSVHAIFCCCHAGTMFKISSSSNNNEQKLSPDFCKSAETFFKSNDSIGFQISSTPKLLVWSACKDDQVSYCNTTNDNWEWRYGYQFTTAIFLIYLETSDYSYEEFWQHLSDDYYATYADEGAEPPTPQKTALNGFDESNLAFNYGLKTLEIEPVNCDVKYSTLPIANINGNLLYEDNSVTLTAVVDDDCRFRCWNRIDIASEESPVHILNNPTTFSLEKTKNGSYQALAEELLTDVDADINYSYSGTNVIVTVSPHTGYKFVSWSDDNTSNPRTFAQDEEIAQYSVNIEPIEESQEE